MTSAVWFSCVVIIQTPLMLFWQDHKDVMIVVAKEPLEYVLAELFLPQTEYHISSILFNFPVRKFIDLDICHS